MSEPEDWAQEAAAEEYENGLLASLREEHGTEIADEVLTDELLGEIQFAHSEWIDRTNASLEKSLLCITDHPEIAIFHMSRAFEGYIKNVFVFPFQSILTEKIQRTLPEKFNFTLGKIFASVNGLGGSETIASYSISLLAKDPSDCKILLKPFEDFVKGTKQEAKWGLRNHVFHAPIAVDQTTAEKFCHTAKAILESITIRVQSSVEEYRERVDFSPARVGVLKFLASSFGIDRERYFSDFEIQVVPLQAGDAIREALCSLENQKYVEGKELEPFCSRAFRITTEGKTYYENIVVPWLSKKTS